MSDSGAQYLPPIITELRGDNSDLLKAFAEAKAAQEAFSDSVSAMSANTRSSTRKAGTDVDDFTDLVVRRMRAGESAVSVLRREMTRLGDDVTVLRKRMAAEGANQGLFADFKRANEELARMRTLARTIAPELLESGRQGGHGFLSGFMSSFAGIGGLMMPFLIGGIILASPAIAALVGSAVTVGLGLGFAGVGIVLAAVLLPKIQRQFYRIGQNFKTAFTGAVSGTFDDELRKALRSFNLMIPTFGAQFRKIFDAIAPALDPLANALGEGLKEFLAEMMQVIPQIMPALMTFISTIPTVMEAVAKFLVEITKNGPALSRFILDASNAIVAFLDQSGKIISWLSAVYLWVVKLNDAFPFMGWQRQLQGLGIAVEAVKNFFVDLWGKITGAAKAVGSWFADLGTAVWSWLKDAGAAIAKWFTDTVGWFKKLPGRVIGFLASMPGRVKNVVSDLAHGAVYWIGWMVGQWVLFITQAPGKIFGAIAALWIWIQDRTAAGVASTIEHIKAFPGQVAAFFSQLWTDVTGWVSRTWTSVVDWFGRTKQSMIEKIAEAITAVIAWFRGLPDKAATEGGKFKDRMIKFFKDAKNWLVEAGKDIVRGVIKGVTDSRDWAVNKIKSFGHDLVSGFKDALGIHSPSKAFEESGHWSAVGYVKGWANTLRRATRGVAGPVLTLTSPPGGAPRPPGYAPGPTSGGASMVHTTIKINDRTIVEAITPASQRRGARSGITGTGVPTARIV